MLNLLDTYRSMLKAAAMIADDEGYVSFDNQMYSDLPVSPVVIDEKRLVLPTMEHLRNPSNSKVAFHPLREKAMQGESEVVAKLRTALSLRLNFNISALLNEFISICKNVADHKHLNPDHLGLVSVGQDVTEDTHIAFTELLKRATEQLGPTKSFVSIYVKKNAQLHGTNYHRAGIATFPIYEELTKDVEKPFGMTINKRERKNLIALLEYLLPDIAKDNTYNRGSNSGVAPFLEGLMRVFGAVASRLNDKYELFEDILKLPQLYIETGWEDSFEDLDKLLPEIQMTPSQPGNEGRAPVAERKTLALDPQTLQGALAPAPAPVTAAPVPYQQPYQHQHHQPQQPTAPALERTSGGVSWRSMAANMGLPAADAYGGGYRPGMPMQHPNAPRSDWNSQFQPTAYQPGYPNQYQNNGGYGGNYGGGYGGTGRV